MARRTSPLNPVARRQGDDDLNAVRTEVLLKYELAAGERWFCTEKDALNAGWRKALNCKK